MPNTELAWKVLDHIYAHPELWEQEAWLRKTACGTVGCFAGWTCLLAGDTPAFVEGSNSTCIVSRGENIGRSNVGIRAAVLLGIDDFAAETLFEFDNSLEDLLGHVREIFGPRPVSARA